MGNLIAWFCTLPAIFVAASALESRGRVAWMDMLPPIAALILLVWASVIYWRFIKKGRSTFLEACCFLGFFVLMAAGGAVSLWLTYWAMLVIHGA